MAEIILSSEELSVFGGPTSINVDVDFGPQGIRGSRIFAVDADPRLSTTDKPADIQNYDIAMVTTPSEKDYLTVYQKLGATLEDWVPFASLIPNVLSVKSYVTFDSGVAIGYIPASDVFQLDTYTPDKFDVHVALENEAGATTPSLIKPTSTGFSLSIIPFGGKQWLKITVTAIEYNVGTLSWVPVTGERIAHLFITTVSEIAQEVTP